MKITITDIAKKAGVSKTTVSRVINGNFHEVTQETKDKVLKVISKMDYTPNALAKGLKSMKTNVLGMILSDLQNPFWTSVLEGAEDACRSLGYNIMICNACKDPKNEEGIIKGLRNKQVDGIIVNSSMKNHALFESLIKDNYPIVALNRRIKDLPIETVAVNNVRGSFMAVDHMIRLGKERIAIIVYHPEGISPRIERIEGYIQALNASGLGVDDSLIYLIEDEKQSAKHALKRILSSPNPPDAVFSTNNIMSLEILEAIKEMQLRIPDDIGLIGYDETVWSQHLNPPLTTVKQPAYEMGELAVKRLIYLIKSKDKPAARVHLLEPTLIVRESCGSQSLKYHER